MIRPRRWLTRAAIALGTALAAGCGAGLSTRPPEAAPRSLPVGTSQAPEPAALAIEDPNVTALATSQSAPIANLPAPSTIESPAASTDLRGIVAMDVAGTSSGIAIPLNDRVLGYLDQFLGRLRDSFADGLARGGRYMAMIQDVLRAEGLPLDLAYVPLIESAFNPNAVSRARAKGTWQFIRGTGVAYGLTHDWHIDERANPEKSTVAAAKYLRALHARFQGDWPLALASYNGGPGLVERAMKRTEILDFWQLSASPRALPRETREYVPMILAAMLIARNPAQYGFDIVPDPPIEYDTVGLPHPVDLGRVAEWIGMPAASLRALNPELRRWTTPSRPPGYELKVPKGTAPIVEARLRKAAPAAAQAVASGSPERVKIVYLVKAGDTLTSIARAHRTTVDALKTWNALRSSRINIGDRLTIYTGRTDGLRP